MAITEAPKIITSRLPYADSHTLERYLATGGYDGLRKALTMTPEDVAHEVDTASLLGRGGAGFPAGRKWAMLRKNPVTYLVVNGDESEPATFKDHLLIERDPHQLIEGVLIAAYALQVTQVFIFIRGEFALGLERVQAALNEAYAYGAVGSDIFGRGSRSTSWSTPVPAPTSAERRRRCSSRSRANAGFPRIKPPFFPAAIGLYGEPTVVNNVETMSNLPWIVLNGGAAFAALGEGRSAGTRLFALAGHVNNPGVFELEMVKTTFNDLINAPVLGGGIPQAGSSRHSSPAGCRRRGSGPTRSIFPSARTRWPRPAPCSARVRSSSWTTPPAWSAPPGASPNSSSASRAASAHRAVRARVAGEDHGAHRDGQGREEDLDLLMDACDNISPGVAWPPQQTTICVLGPSIPPSIGRPEMFRDEYLAHINEGGCPYA